MTEPKYTCLMDVCDEIFDQLEDRIDVARENITRYRTDNDMINEKIWLKHSIFLKEIRDLLRMRENWRD